MAISLRSELRKALAADIQEYQGEETARHPSRRNLMRLQRAREALALVEKDRSAFPQIERIAIDLWQGRNGDYSDPLKMDPLTRKVALEDGVMALLAVRRAADRNTNHSLDIKETDMSIARHLPSGSENTAIEQGWNAESLVIHLSGFIVGKKLEGDLAQYMADAAAEENADLSDSTDEDEDREDDDAPE